MLTRRKLLRAGLAAPALLIPHSSPLALEQVNLNLVLAIDSSLSTEPKSGDEFRIQKEGHAKAIQSPQVIAAIQSPPHYSVAVSAVIWSLTYEALGESYRTGVPWMRIGLLAEAEHFAGQLLRCVPLNGDTEIARGIEGGLEALARSPYIAPRQVIDISTDEVSLSGLAAEWRGKAEKRGVTINGIALEKCEVCTSLGAKPADVHGFLKDEVITPDGFAVRAEEVTYEDIILWKMETEIQGMV